MWKNRSENGTALAGGRKRDALEGENWYQLADDHAEDDEDCGHAVGLEQIYIMREIGFTIGCESHNEGLDSAVGINAGDHRQ